MKDDIVFACYGDIDLQQKSIFNILVDNLSMGFSEGKKKICMGGLIVVTLLVGMHLLTGIKGYNYFKDVVQLKALDPRLVLLNITYREYQARVIMLIAVACLTFVTNLANIWLLTTTHRKWLQHLTVFNLVIAVSVGLLQAISLFQMATTRDVYIDKIYPSADYANSEWDKDGFNTFWRILIADTALSFIPTIAFWLYFYDSVVEDSYKLESQLTVEGNYNKI